jgi:hypothetical protein
MVLLPETQALSYCTFITTFQWLCAFSIQGDGSSIGLSAWRLLNDYPYYRLALSTDEEQAIWRAKQSWWNWVPFLTSSTKQVTSQDITIS